MIYEVAVTIIHLCRHAKLQKAVAAYFRNLDLHNCSVYKNEMLFSAMALLLLHAHDKIVGKTQV